MLFKSYVHLLIYSSFLLIQIHCQDYSVRCSAQTTAVDQGFNDILQVRKKRFVLFPEFINYIDDWRYIHAPKQFTYWIANFYPNRLDTEIIHSYIKEIIRQINLVIDTEITISVANDPGEANFHFHFFDYTICPTDDPNATVTDMKIYQKIMTYPKELTRKNRYRANGGINIFENNRLISEIKLNMQQTFLYSEDFIYDSLLYTCVDDLNQCQIDLFWTLLHETLHGFGIEHTTNHQKPQKPNPNMQSVMHFSNLRFLCHDDIRAIRMVYNATVKRENAVYDDTCRRDFPLSKLQKLMKLIGRSLMLGFAFFGIASVTIFILTLIYLLARLFRGKRSNEVIRKPSPIVSKVKIDRPIIKTNRTKKPHGYLWHDDMI